MSIVVFTDVATGEITALKHELRDHTVEFGASVAKALLTGAKSTEVFSSLWNRIIVELEVNAALLVCENVSIKIEIGRPLRVLQSRVVGCWRRWGN